jgi:hypothetical protein
VSWRTGHIRWRFILVPMCEAIDSEKCSATVSVQIPLCNEEQTMRHLLDAKFISSLEGLEAHIGRIWEANLGLEGANSSGVVDGGGSHWLTAATSRRRVSRRERDRTARRTHRESACAPWEAWTPQTGGRHEVRVSGRREASRRWLRSPARWSPRRAACRSPGPGCQVGWHLALRPCLEHLHLDVV